VLRQGSTGTLLRTCCPAAIKIPSALLRAVIVRFHRDCHQGTRLCFLPGSQGTAIGYSCRVPSAWPIGTASKRGLFGSGQRETEARDCCNRQAFYLFFSWRLAPKLWPHTLMASHETGGQSKKCRSTSCLPIPKRVAEVWKCAVRHYESSAMRGQKPAWKPLWFASDVKRALQASRRPQHRTQDGGRDREDSASQDKAWALSSGSNRRAQTVSRHVQGLPRSGFRSQESLLGKDRYGVQKPLKVRDRRTTMRSCRPTSYRSIN
jgi:hypothetical protein